MKAINGLKKYLYWAMENPYRAIFIIIFVVYSHMSFYGYSYWDDVSLIVKDRTFIGNLENLKDIIGRNYFSAELGVYSSRPVVTLSYMLDAQWGGINPWVFHFTNVLLFIFAGFVIYRLFDKIKIRQGPALLMTLAYLFHPIFIPVVAWIPGRNDSLLLIFFAGSIIYLIKYLDDNALVNYLLHQILFAVAIFTKENAIVLPLISLMLMLGKGRSGIFKKINILLIGGNFIILVIWQIARIIGMTKIAYFIVPYNKWYDILLAMIGYLGKIIFPYNLSLISHMDRVNYISGFLLIIFISYCIFKYGVKNKMRFITGFVWFFALLFPTMVYRFEFTGFLEHRLFLPALGLMISFDQIKLDTISSNKHFKYLKIWLTCVLLISSILYGMTYRSGLACWERAVKIDPYSSAAQNNLGVMYLNAGDNIKAENCFVKAINLNYNWSDPHYNLAKIYYTKGEFDKALTEYELVIKNDKNPNILYDALIKSGYLLIKQNRLDEACMILTKAAIINPAGYDAYYNLSWIYNKLGKYKEARACLQKIENMKNVE